MAAKTANKATPARKRKARASFLALEKLHKQLELNMRKHKGRLKAMEVFKA